MKNVNKKILLISLAVMMFLGSFAMVFAYADTTVTTPKDYANAADGEKLWDVDFSSSYFTPIDDTTIAYDNNGVTYTDQGLPCPVDPADNVDGNGDGDTKDLYSRDQAAFLNGWRRSISETATVIEEGGKALKIDGAVPAIGVEGEEGYVIGTPSDVTAANSLYAGQINAYDLENKTYTYVFEYFRKGIARSKFYFGNGMFLNFGGSDQHMPCLGIELNASGYRLMRSASAITQNVVGKPSYTVVEATGETTAQMKVVLSGGAILEDVTLWTGSWFNTPDQEDPEHNVAHWTGDAIIVDYSIYCTLTKSDGTVQDIRCSTGSFVQPADVKLVFGIGEYNKPANNQYYGARNLAIYKGDTSVPFDFGFEKVYAETAWGSELTKFDTRGITNAAYNYTLGYEWTTLNNADGITVDADGAIIINRSDRATTHGVYTPHPFGEEWNQGYYEMELSVNNASRLKIGLLQLADCERVGFNILPNVANADLTVGSKDAYLHADASNAASLWTSYANSFGIGIVEKSVAALADYVKTIVYDTYDVTDANEDGQPDDPRNVRDYGGNRANIKITYDCENYIITLYEKCDGEWLPTAAIDYSKAVEQGKLMGACLDFQAFNMNTNATIKNIRVRKGMSASHLHTYQIGAFKSEIFSTFDAEYAEYIQGRLDDVATAYTARYGLFGIDWAWGVNGKPIETIKDAYNALDPTNYGVQNINFEPLVLECLGTCVDADNNHKCDNCRKDISVCVDNDNDHICDVCKAVMSRCADGDNDHLCDICKATLSECVDKTKDHYCDICGDVTSDCYDRDLNHFCDVCHVRISDCVDYNRNHICDLCDQEMVVCADNDLDHNCDFCGNTLTACIDRNKDHECDICCGKVGVHAFKEGSVVCEYCGESDQNSIQFKVENGILFVSYDFGESWIYVGSITGNNDVGGDVEPIKHNYTTEVIAPTCTAQGYTAHTCECGDYYRDNYTPALGHSFGEWEVVASATCTTTGVARRTCSTCDYSETRAIDAKGHSFGAWKTVTSPTCTATGTERRDCANCDQYETRTTDATGHDYTAVVTAPTCTEEGYTTYTCACGYSYKDDYVSVTEHSFGAWKTVTSPTCTATGTERRDCSKCSYFEARDIYAKGHTYTSVVTAPTCTTMGYTTYTCACSYSYTSNYIDALGHNEIAHEAKAPTCTAIGWDAYVTCSRCDYTTYAEKAALGHNEVAHDAQAPTCIEIGWDAYVTCSRCDYTTYAEKAAFGHSHTAVVTAPTCTAQGYTTHTCVCGDSYVDTYVDAIGHNEVAHNAQSPTCTEIGWDAYVTCSRCDYTTYVEKTSLGHSYENGACTVCGAEYFSEGLYFVSNYDGTCYVDGMGSCKDRELYIPRVSPAGDTVTGIGVCAFESRTDLTTVIIPDSVKSISSCAFRYCTNLTTITIPDSVTSMGGDVFYGCTGLTEINFNATAMDDLSGYIFRDAGQSGITVNIGANVTKIPAYLCGSSNITSVVFAEGSVCESIGQYAFEYCDSLTSITIPNSVTSIGSDAFRDCTGLTSITIPDSVTSIDSNAFYNCTNLESVYYDGNIASWCAIEFESGYANPIYYAEKLYVKNSVGEYELVTNLIIPNTVTEIKPYAFCNYNELLSVTLPEGLTTIGANAFYNCKGLASITLPSSLMSIGSNAFEGCTSLVEIYNLLNANITPGNSGYGGVAEYALFVYTNAEIESKIWRNDDGFIFYEDGDTCYLVGYVGDKTDVTLPENCHGKNYVINKKAFYDRNDITSVAIPDSVTSIDMHAFAYCDNLESVTIGDGMTRIGYYAFGSCSNLTSITFNGTKAEFHSISLSSDWNDNVPAMVVTCSDGTTSFSHNYASVVTAPTCTEQGYTTHTCNCGHSYVDTYVDALGHNRVDGVCTRCGDGRVSQGLEFTSKGDGTCSVTGIGTCTDTDIIIPSVSPAGDTVTSIGDSAFHYCTSLTSITIPDGVTSIGNGAFSDCTGLASITIPDSVTSVGDQAFYNTLYFHDESNWENGVLYIGDHLLDAKNDISGTYEIKAGTKTIAGGAFYNCTRLTSITIPNSVTSIGISAFRDCTGLTSITIPDSVISIGHYAFQNCTGLTSITIGNSVTNIGNSAFRDCTGLTSITIPDRVTSIGNDAFAYCNNLRSVRIGNGVKAIGQQAFSACGIMSIAFNGTKAEWNSIMLGNQWNYGIATATVSCSDGNVTL